MSSHLRGIGMTSQRTRERLITRLREEGIRNESVLDVVRTTPRHIFVDEALATRAYEDTALPIGYGQTISQPYTVARMTELLLSTGPVRKVLEVGGGSGYQTAVLAQLVEEVYSVERIGALMRLARQRLRELNIRNVRFKHADGNWGWSEHGPYDGILVAAAPARVPEGLCEQLDVGGCLVIPTGGNGDQDLLLIRRTSQGFERHTVEKVSFVPLLNGLG